MPHPLMHAGLATASKTAAGGDRGRMQSPPPVDGSLNPGCRSFFYQSCYSGVPFKHPHGLFFGLLSYIQEPYDKLNGLRVKVAGKKAKIDPFNQVPSMTRYNS